MQQTILIAEEDQALAQRIRHALEASGYRVFTVQSCSAAISCLMTEQIELLVLDHTLPNDGGLTVLQVLRENARTKILPIIMLTNNMETADVYHTFDLGVDSLQSNRPDHIHALTLELTTKIKRIFKSINEDSLMPPLAL